MHHSTNRRVHTLAFVTPVVKDWLELEIVPWVHLRDQSEDAPHYEQLFYHGATSRCWVPCVEQHAIDTPPLSYFSFQPVFHDWFNKGRGMYYPIFGMVHIKEPLLLIGRSNPCSGSWFRLSQSEWFFTICLTPYIRK